MFERLPHDLERVRLRTLRPGDLDAFHGYRSDPIVARYQGWEPMTTSEAADFLQTQASQTSHAPGAWRQLAIADLESDLLIGDIGVWLAPDCLQAEFGLSITPVAQGHGYGVECVRGLMDLLFSATPVQEIVASTDIRNAACLAVLARAGMRHVDTRQAEYKGEVCTEHTFSVGRQTWRRIAMAPQLDHLIVHSRDRSASAKLLAGLLDVPWSETGVGPFSPVYVNEGLTLDFDESDEPFPVGHYAFRVGEAEFDAILGRIEAAGIQFRSTPHGPVDMRVNTDHGGRIVYWNKPDGHVWELLTVSYARQARSSGAP